MGTLHHLDTVSRSAVREHLDMDERMEHTAELMQLLSQLAQKVGEAQRELAGLDETNPSPELAAYVAGLLGPSRRHQVGPSAVSNLLASAQDRAVLLARAHGASWAKIGEYLGEIGENLRTRYLKK